MKTIPNRSAAETTAHTPAAKQLSIISGRARALVAVAGSLVVVALAANAAMQQGTQPTTPAAQTPPDAPGSAAPETQASQAPAQPQAEQPAVAQDPQASTQNGSATAPATPPIATPMGIDSLGRRVPPDEPTKLSFRGVSVEQLIPFIVESTGKVVLPQQDVLSRRITLLNDKAIPRQQALDLVFLALQQNGVAVVENPDLILLRDQADVDRQSIPVLGPEKPVADRTDLGSVLQKVFSLKSATAANVAEVLRPSIPDFARMSVDPDSNQILITGPVALLQRLEKVIVALDKPAAAALATETFHLRFADAELVAQNIRDLFADANAQGARRTGNTAAQAALQQAQRQFGVQGGGRQQQQQQQQQQGGQNAATSVNLRVTSNTQQNSVTVLGEQQIIDQVRKQILEQWDRPLPEEAVIPRVYELKNTDPVKMKETLEGLFGQGTQTTVGTQQGQRTTALQQGVGRLAGQFSFQAIPEAGRLVVVARSPDNMSVIDKIIEDLDQPTTAGLPEVVELKHANADDLAEQLNALLAQEGTLASVRRATTGLSASSAAGASPFASDTATTTTGENAQQNTTATGDALQFWWQRARPPTDSAGSSNLISKARIVPVSRQNAVMVLAPLEYKRSIVEIIERLDKPGRQVLIAAVIVELTGEDATALGVRFSNSAITPTNSDNAIGIGSSNNGPIFTGTNNELANSLFDTSVLNVGVNVNVLLQALAQNTQVRILSEPRIFTSDNQEAIFFDGQDIPFITDTQTATGTTGLVQSFDYRAVGIQLRVRPRITPERDVDLRVNLQLSNTVAGQTLFGGAIVDRRETTTQLIVGDGQTVVISGIMRTEDTETKRKIPLLGDIPILGLPFTSTERSKTNTELVAFITPVVVNNREESDRLNDPLRKRLGDLRDHLQDKSGAAPAGEPSAVPDRGEPER